MQQKDLVIPIYIDTNALLDLLASIEDGFSVVEKVTTRNSDSKNINREVKADTGTEFGIPNVLSMLKLNIGYSSNWKKTREDGKESQTDRYHTYGSLFYRLREFLEQNELIKYPSQDHIIWEDIKASDFIEIHGIFRPNPLSDSLKILCRTLDLFMMMSDYIPNNSSVNISNSRLSKQPARNQQKSNTPIANSRNSFNQEQLKQIEQFKNFFIGILKDIQTDNVFTFVTDIHDIPEHQAVSLVYSDYLRDQTIREISHKEYRMLGKVVRKIDKEDSETIDLLLGTGLGGISRSVLDQIITVLGIIPGMNLPKIQTEIKGPALEIVPVAIYV
jgi:hypothetical protein